jgi:hypothetical protein
MPDINYLAVVAAAVSTFLIGGLWYSPLLLQRVWMRANDIDEEDLKKGSAAVIFGLSFVFSLVMAAGLAALLAGPETTVARGVATGALAGFGWVALGIAIVSLFERRPWSYMLVNGGYFVVAFSVMGAILGGWR